MAKTSDPPNGLKIYVPPKLVIIILVVLVGGGAGGVGLSSFIRGDESMKTAMPSDVQFNVRFERLETGQAVNTEKIEKLDEQVGQIQSVQHADIARTEARRMTEKIRSRIKREQEYDRIFILNMARLKKGKEPCQSVECGE